MTGKQDLLFLRWRIMVMWTLPRLAFFFFFLMKCSFVEKITSVSFYIWKGYKFFFFPPSVWIAHWCTLELNNPLWCHPDFRGLERWLSLPSSWLLTSYTCLYTEALEVTRITFAWIFIKVPVLISSISSSTASHFPLRKPPASTVWNAENGCLRAVPLLEETTQEVFSCLWSQLTIWILASGSCWDLGFFPPWFCVGIFFRNGF